MGFLDHIEACNRHDLRRFRPVEVVQERTAGERCRVGWLREDRLGLLAEVAEAAQLSRVVQVSEQSVCLDAGGEQALSRALAAVVAELQVRAAIRDCNELHAVRHRVGGRRLGRLDRGAVPFFGVAATGVHLNGFVRSGEGLRMWIAHRARGKTTFPGMLDNMVAGGQPDGLSVGDNVLKECGEEAGIPSDLASRARAVGAVSYVYENESGLKPDTMYCYDLELPAGFEPRPVDGEVERFELLPLDEVAALVRDTGRFKFNCNLVILDFLVRHGWFTPEDPQYLALVSGLHRALPDLDGTP